MLNNKGFTLIELLIASAVGVVILGIMIQQMRGTADSTTSLINSQAMLEDLRATSNYMADNLSRASYIYRPGSTVTMGGTTGYTVYNKRTAKNLWEVGKDSIVAMLLPPEDATTSCSVATPTGCMYFVAFYPLERKHVYDKSSGAENPGRDDRNEKGWVIYEYRERIGASDPDTYINDNKAQLKTPSFTVGSGNILGDYIAPLDAISNKGGLYFNFEDNYYRCYDNSTALGINGKCDNILRPTASVSRLFFTVQMSITSRERTVKVPSSPLVFEVATRNVVTTN